MKEQKGYVIVEHLKNGKEKKAICVVRKYEEANSENLSLEEKNKIFAISGFGELYYCKEDAEGHCDELNKLWCYPAFKVKKAKLIF